MDTKSSANPVRVLICGTGASGHALAGVISNTQDVEVRIFTRNAGKARRWNQLKDEAPLTVSIKDGETRQTLEAQPFLVTDCPECAARDCDMVIFALPAFAHATYLRLLQPYLEDGCIIVGLPGQNGFELEVRALLGDRLDHCVLMNVDTFPWICRSFEFGRRVSITGVKKQLLGALQGSLKTARITDPVSLLQRLLGKFSRLAVSGHLLGITLISLNAYSHPPVMYRYWKDWDGKSFSKPPYFYREIDFESADLMEKISAEVVATSRHIMNLFPQVDLSQVIPMYDWDLACYGDVIEDTTNEMTVLRTNPGYRDITYPMIRLEDGTYVPDFNHRYLAEDVPYGLVVIRGITEIAGVATPHLDKVLTWCQEKLGQEYLVDGRLAGRDLDATRCPQKYGVTTLSELLGLSIHSGDGN